HGTNRTTLMGTESFVVIVEACGRTVADAARMRTARATIRTVMADDFLVSADPSLNRMTHLQKTSSVHVPNHRNGGQTICQTQPNLQPNRKAAVGLCKRFQACQLTVGLGSGCRAYLAES